MKIATCSNDEGDGTDLRPGPFDPTAKMEKDVSLTRGRKPSIPWFQQSLSAPNPCQ